MKPCRWLFTLVVATAARGLDAQVLVFPVNTFPIGNQVASDVAALGPAGFVVVWGGLGPTNPGESEVYARRVSAAGVPLAAEFRVNTTTSLRGSPSVASSANGSFVVTWALDSSLNATSTSIWAQRFGTSGQPLGGEFRVNTTTTSVVQPDVAMDGSGGFVIVWTAGSSGSGLVMGQRFDASGSPRGGEFLVTSAAPAFAYTVPSVAADDAGNFIVAWTNVTGTAVTRRFASTGAPVTPDLPVPASPLPQVNPFVSMNPDGSSEVAWEFGVGGTAVVGAQRYSAGGALAGPSFQVNLVSGGTLYVAPGIAQIPGGFFVSWEKDAVTVFGDFYRSSGERYPASNVPDFPIGPPAGAAALLSRDRAPRAAFSPDGRGLLVYPSTLADGNGFGIFGAMLEAPVFPVGSEFRVNTLTTKLQQYPRVAASSKDGFLVVWHGNPGGTPDRDIWAQRFDGNGAPLAGEFRVNSYTTGSQAYSDVARLANGAFVVAWGGEGSGDGYGIFGRLVSADGTPLGSDFSVNTAATGYQYLPRIGSNATGSFVIAWVGSSTGIGQFQEIFARRFGSNGAPVGVEFRANTVTTGEQRIPAVVVDPTGGFLVIWGGRFVDTYDIVAQRFASSGSPIAGEFRLNDAAGFQGAPSAASALNGDFVVAWGGDGDGSSSAVTVRRFSSSAAPLGAETRINTYVTGDQVSPAVSVSPDGDFAVVWGSNGQDGSNYGVFGRLFRDDGTARGTTEFRANTYTSFAQKNPAVALGPKMMVVWRSLIQDGDSYGIYGQITEHACRSSDEDGNGVISVSDVLYLINHLFAGGPAPRCGGDADGNGVANVSDVLYLINHLFAGGPPPI